MISWRIDPGNRLRMTFSFEVDNETSSGTQFINVNFSDTECVGDTPEARERVLARARRDYNIPQKV